ncbi:hypothetical protein M3Y98_00852200 [Aphelenchoides besseyi]|nr:hypothetical protein M3Y98_00852200 [Aphelenchoides besseyi]KAI6195288.1 hypothetical protein M3Y96_01214900 [Aphelenchoides besseyi]KAI6222752.1 hypothetical protein M3Y95_00927000 [Aphelenchoides besseyi]
MGMIEILTLQENNVEGFWQMWFSIFAWMAASYIFVHLVAFLVSIVKLRHHPWVGYLSFPFIVMIFLGPTTIGALTSASIALTFAMAQKSITAWYCMFIGCGQTLMVLLTSFLRILGTL